MDDWTQASQGTQGRQGSLGHRRHGGGLLLICSLTLSSDPVIEIEMLTHLKNN